MNDQEVLAVEWRDIPGYEGLYQVSSDGQVKRLEAIVQRKNGSGLSNREHLLAPRVKNSGYLFVSLSKSNKRQNAYIHHLVAYAFVGARPDGYDINHVDGNKLNNAAINLEYVTRTENMRHAREKGLHDNRGEKQWKAKLSDDDAYMIKTVGILCLDEISVSYMARHYGVSVNTIWCVVNGKTFKHISGC